MDARVDNDVKPSVSLRIVLATVWMSALSKLISIPPPWAPTPARAPYPDIPERRLRACRSAFLSNPTQAGKNLSHAGSPGRNGLAPVFRREAGHEVGLAYRNRPCSTVLCRPIVGRRRLAKGTRRIAAAQPLSVRCLICCHSVHCTGTTPSTHGSDAQLAIFAGSAPRENFQSCAGSVRLCHRQMTNGRAISACQQTTCAVRDLHRERCDLMNEAEPPNQLDE